MLSAPIVRLLSCLVLAATPGDPPAAAVTGSPPREQGAAAARSPQREPGAADPGTAADTSRPRPSSAKVLSAKVLFITAKDSAQCDEELARLRRPGGDFALLTSKGWKIGDAADSHLQVVDREAVADLVKQLGITRFPTVAAVRDGQIVRSFQYGCTTPLDKWTFGFLAKGVDERPPGSVPEAARVETTGNYPLRGNHWSVDDDWNPSREKVINHLRGPVHGGQTARYPSLESWSYEELRSLHDNLHEIEMGGVQYGGQFSSSPQSDPFSATRKTLGK